jgi:hypothetical protein
VRARGIETLVFGGGGAEGVWYLAELLFAEPPLPDRAKYQCESSNVLFQAETAVEAYRKAVAWGVAYAAEPPAGMRLLGVAHLSTVGEELGDGTEICGRFFQAPAVWESSSGMVPPTGQFKAVQWEQGRNVPLGELLSPEQIAQVRRAWGQDAEPLYGLSCQQGRTLSGTEGGVE